MWDNLTENSFKQLNLFKLRFMALGDDYMISVSRDEILSRLAGIPTVL